MQNTPSERDLLIALSLLPFLTPNRTRLLLETFEPIAGICSASLTLLRTLLHLAPEQAAALVSAVRDCARPEVTALRSSVITLVDPQYPRLLREIPDPPLVLHVRGNIELLQTPAVSVVGSRRASPYAINAAEHLAADLSAAGLTIVSGLARGIDAAAHTAALDAGGATVAVLGTGIDVIYPRSHGALFRRMESHGVIISEFPSGTPPRRENFPVRNRIISGLSHGTVIVEATSRSGSLITARLAAEQGREVFAVPGSIFSAGSEGTHRLIQYGAKLVHDADDVLDELPAGLRPAKKKRKAAEPSERLRPILAALAFDEGRHVDWLAERMEASSGEIAEQLLELELGGWIRALPGARFIRTA